MRFEQVLDRLAQDPALISVAGLKTAELGVPDSALPMVLAQLARSSSRSPLVVITPTTGQAERLCHDLNTWLSRAQVQDVQSSGPSTGASSAVVLPAWETLPFERVSPGLDTMGQRLEVLYRLSHSENKAGCADVIVVPVRALLQRLSPTTFEVEPIEITLGSVLDPDQLISELVKAGYRRDSQVENRGDFALRGSIIDIYPANRETPVRVDLWGDEVERLSEFSVSDQRSTRGLQSVRIFASREFLITDAVIERARELLAQSPWGSQHWQRFIQGQYFDGMESWLPWFDTQMRPLSDLIPDSAHLLLIDPTELARRARDLLSEEADLVTTLAATWGKADDDTELPRLHIDLDTALANTGSAMWSLTRPSLSEGANNVEASRWESGSGAQRGPVNQLLSLINDGYDIIACADSESSAVRIAKLLAENGIELSQNLNGIVAAPDIALRSKGGAAHSSASQLVVAPLLNSAIFKDLKLALLAEPELTGRRRSHRRVRRRAAASSDIDDLKVGSYVVHRQHGIARFSGLEKRSIGGVERDYLILEYRGSDKLFLPSEQIDAIRHYTGGDSPKLSKMGGADWQKTKAKAKSAAAEVAQELVVLYQKRVATPGHSFAADTPWQAEMEAAFPYRETPDQLKAIEAVKDDMHQSRPMDRLVCGDVGFGKTEIAIRATFKAVQDSKQVAILVPTTLLAQQHFQTFSERFAGYPTRVEVLSRFLTNAQAKAVLKDLANGEVDVIIGTHRILSKDVKIPNLGLLVVDEEQRFGVKHKELIKEMKAAVDVLTLTATPIPRTLEMSLTGIRDLTLLQTPPAARQPILTHVGEYDERAVTEAIRRELLREGQVFFVHNRVRSIEQVAQEISDLVPEARVAVAHGQMDEGSLEQVVYDFWEHKFDVLVCTTIIESGIDMPSVNTLVVDRADLLGLGQLHQLRGRVGRSGQRGYAYLFYPEDRVLSEEAYERLKAIGDATELGSGFRLAMRDLEIRGAGNLVGTGQSGHIAAVGYDLYCQLVTEAVSNLKGEEEKEVAQVKIEIPVPASLPVEYVEKETARLSQYRALSYVQTHREVEDIRAEWLDRFGPIPEPAQALLAIATLRVMALEAGIEQITTLKGPGFGGPKAVAKIVPVSLAASKEIRLSRKYKNSEYQAGAKLLKLAVTSRPDALIEVAEALVDLEIVSDPKSEIIEESSVAAGGADGDSEAQS